MKERVRQIFQSLPPEGVAIHGTNLARAKRIQQEGFQPQHLHPRMPVDETHYFVQPPNFNPTYAGEHIQDLRQRFRDALLKYAQRAITEPKYKVGDEMDDNIPALVVFKPLQRFDMSLIANNVAPFSIHNKEKRNIPPQNIYGIIPVPIYMGSNELILDTFRLLEGKRVINSAKLPQLQKA